MPTHSTVPSDSALNFSIVGIGASAGGLRALEDFFENMPADSGAAFVVVQHLSPDFKSLMNELLKRRTNMSVNVVTEGLLVEPNAIYLIPPGQNLELRGRRLHLTMQDRGAGHSPNYPIDLLFQSLATDAKERAVSIVLSGTGSDGTRGIQQVSEMGGIVLVQDPNTAEFDGMPQSAIATGTVDLVLPPNELAQTTYRFVTTPQAKDQTLEVENQQTGLIEPHHLRRIVRILERHENIDFTHYKPKTLTRRINRRCLLAGFTDLDSYIDHLESSAEEWDILRNELLITVTHFFRDTEAWDKLEHEILPQLIKEADPKKGLRIWITACATGEEAYSMGILVKELLDKAQSKTEVKIFATDVDPIALAKASAGIFPDSIINNLSAERLSRFFTPVGTEFEVSRALRETIIFANHNLTKDAGFTQMDLVSCRNVLIYMQPDLQQQVLRTLHFSLKVNRILFLGESENLGSLEEEFKPLDRKWKIYEKLRDIRLPLVNLALAAASSNNQRRMQSLYRKPEATAKFNPLIEEAFQALLSDQEATCFLVNRDSQLLHLCSDALNLLTVSSGPATQDVIKMLPEPIRLALNTALHRAYQTGVTVRYSHCPLAPDKNGEARSVSLKVTSCTNQSAGKFLMVVIEEEDRLVEADLPEQFTADRDASQYIAQLQQELQATRENLQATIEELETTNEEQQATNEELIASNEELQSTNEELHSVNEELYTVNSEHQSKIQQLVELNNDHDNLLNSIRIGVIYLADNNSIRKFTPDATLAFNLVQADIGRPLEHLSHNLEGFDVQEAIEQASQGNVLTEHSVKVKRGGPHLLMRIHPYLNEDKDIQGSVITLVNVNDIQKAQAQLAEAETRLRLVNENLEQEVQARTAELHSHQQLLQSITQATPNGIYIYDLENQENIYSNNYLESLLGYSSGQIQDMGETLLAQIIHPDDMTKIVAHHDRIRRSQTDDDSHDRTNIFDLEYRIKHSSGQWRYFYSQDIIFTRSPSGQPTQILGTAIDVSDRKATANELKRANRQLQDEIIERQQVQTELAKRAHDLERSNSDLEQFAYVVSHDLQEPLRAMTVFSQLLEQRYQNQLEETAQQYINNIVNGGVRMQALIDGILDFSRIAHRGDQFELTDLNDALKAALINLQAAQDSHGATITYDELPTLPIDLSQISQLFQNLLGNAIKFQGQQPPSIHISAEPASDAWPQHSQSEITAEGSGWVFSVKDNGIGMAAEQQGRIFSLFQRLHTRREVSGYGIGLAICKKIVERHSGNIWVKSAPEQGSTFYFTLRSSQPEHDDATATDE